MESNHRFASESLLDMHDFKPTSDVADASTIPARWYTDSRFLELEKERIFYKTWQKWVLNGLYIAISIIHAIIRI